MPKSSLAPRANIFRKCESEDPLKMEVYIYNDIVAQFHHHYKEEHIEHKAVVEIYNGKTQIFKKYVKEIPVSTLERSDLLDDIFLEMLDSYKKFEGVLIQTMYIDLEEDDTYYG